MDYEKKYKGALKVAQKLYQDCPNGKNDRLYHTTDLEKMFPELRESEDERIRKELIEHVKDQQSSFISAPDCRDKYEEEENNKYNAWIAWLEKQGTSYTKRDVDDAYVEGMAFAKDELEKQGEQPSVIRWYDVSLIPQEMEELLVEWDSEDATWHEIAFYHADTKTFWNGTRQVNGVTRWCYIIDLLEKQGEQEINEPDWCHHKVDLSDCSEEYRKAYYDGWNNCNQQHAQLKAEQKSVWSEEDEHRVKDTIYFLETAKKHYASTVELGACIDWLKSLKPQNRDIYNPYKEVVSSIAEMCDKYKSFSDDRANDFVNNVKVKCKDAKEYDSIYPQNIWKPSDEQMNALWDKISNDNLPNSEKEISQQVALTELYEQLKKLREE